MFAVLALTAAAFTSCKEKGNEAETAEAQEVAEASAVAAPYSVDIAASQITWKGSKPTGTHNGTIKLESGSFSIEDGQIAAGSLKIDMNSITDLDLDGGMKENLEAHLKGTVEGKEGDFFNVTQFPFATFELTQIQEIEGQMMLKGNLTIKEKTNNVEFPVKTIIDGDQLILKSEPFKIDRTLWDVNYGSKSIFDNLGDKFINDDIEIAISVLAKKA